MGEGGRGGECSSGGGGWGLVFAGGGAGWGGLGWGGGFGWAAGESGDVSQAARGIGVGRRERVCGCAPATACRRQHPVRPARLPGDAAAGLAGGGGAGAAGAVLGGGGGDRP